MSKRDDRADAKRLRVEVAEETAASERLKATYGGSFCAVEDYLRHSDAAAAAALERFEADRSRIDCLEKELAVANLALVGASSLAGENAEKLRKLELRANLMTDACNERSFESVVDRFARDLVAMLKAEQSKAQPSFKSIIDYQHHGFKEGHEAVTKG